MTFFSTALLSIGLLLCVGAPLISAQEKAVVTPGKKVLPLPGESFQLNGHDAFVILPKDLDPAKKIPWIWYAPTLKGLPQRTENWMIEQFLAAGIAFAGIDVGESYGSPDGVALFDQLHTYLVTERNFTAKPCLLARSRGGLMLYSWAADHPEKVSGIAGIYPVCNVASYPGLKRAAPAYGLTMEELTAELTKYNPVDRLAGLAKAKIPLHHLHGDSDKVVPLDANSGLLAERYKALGGPIELEVIKGGGHDMNAHWFQSQPLVDFLIQHAKAAR